MKKPVLSTDEPESKKALRADRPPTEGFTIIVDGHLSQILRLSMPLKHRGEN
jgi:hypothetical protein